MEAKVKEIKEKEKAEKYEENLVHSTVCAACLNEQRIQRKIDDRLHDQRLFESTLSILICNHCKHANPTRDGDDTICADCGTLQDPDAVGGYRN